ncbi:hypothetical protein LH447_12495 [Laribacter hongkongensis]|nr:hypothetical protein [Laribacter hongkongensis]
MRIIAPTQKNVKYIHIYESKERPHMKRAPELVRFSLEHHSALVLAKRISNAGGRPEALAEVMPDREFLAELEAHFSAEETRLKREPALLPQLAARLADDHCSLRALI